ncbi:SMC-Scp complex subunit ScpB [Paractinoplanes globisporus]|uniref:SMC-Scp complex subunit ScpB n=1 Tax=Paractinoplanes globisporus TaxID=113565 RepID=A0ABW6WYH5_9ACTN
MSEPAEQAALSGAADAPASVDQPRRLPTEEVAPEPSVGEIGPDLSLPEAVQDAAEEGAEDEPVVDEALPLDGDDAGGVFDQAAHDDVSDDEAVDPPVEELVPIEDAAGGDEGSTQPAADDGADRAPVTAAVPEQGRRSRGGSAAVGEPSARTAEELPELTDDAELCAALEAIMLVVDEPVAEMQLAQILEQPTERIGAMLENLSARYTAAGHGFDLRRAAGGWRLYTRPEYAAYVERFVLDGQSVRLTQAALETLAVVAYKQPVTRSRISAIRGVNCDGVMRTLVTRGLIEECGVEGETGAYLYRTTPLFLEKLGINSVDQLPPLAPFLPDDVEEVLDAPG